MLYPKQVASALRLLNNAGFEAYIVGGSLRDSILGRSVNDWDITTSALPSEILEVFCDYKTIQTGIKHGTVTVICEGMPLEITTFRIDGEYRDNRHPDNVLFTDRLSADLARRDFTVNAMAYSEEAGVIDLYGGQKDLETGIIRCVGDAGARFEEDALRIMRALRFSAELGFKIDEATKKAVFEKKELLKNISVERLATELVKLLCGKNAYIVLSEFAEVFFVFIPELSVQYKHPQKGKKHAYDIWEHTCHTVDNTDRDRILRLTMLLHDSGKVKSEGFDENGNSTFKHHAEIGGEIAREILTRLRFDKKTIDTVSFLVSVHDRKVPGDKPTVKRYLRDLGNENFLRLMKIRKADRGALADGFNDISGELSLAYSLYDEIIENNECFSLSSLSVDGKKLKAIGIQGIETGCTLEKLLDAVIDDKVINDTQALLEYTKRMDEIK